MNGGTSDVPLADRVNTEPPILNGMSASEAVYVFSASGVLFVLVGILIWIITGFWPLFVGCAVGGPVSTVWFSSKHLAILKRNRPDGYHVQLIRRRLARWGLIRSPFIRHSGWWSIGRSL